MAFDQRQRATTRQLVTMAQFPDGSLVCLGRFEARSRQDTTNGKFGAFIGRGRGLQGAGTAAVWNSGILIRDPYSASPPPVRSP